jgi:hypothetical protein
MRHKLTSTAPAPFSRRCEPSADAARVHIGRGYIRPAQRVEGDALAIQGAFLDRRADHAVARRHPAIAMVRDAVAAFVRWC